MTKPRVIIADNHRLFVAGLEQLLAQNYDIVSTVFDEQTLLADVRRLRPDLVVLDIAIRPLNGMEIIRAVQSIEARIGVVVVTMRDDPGLAAAALRQGASAYILKTCSVSELLEAVQATMARRTYITPILARGMIQSLTQSARSAGAPDLTVRQRDVLRLLAEGNSMKEVAAVLNLTPRTVAFHKYRMMHLLNIKSSAGLVRFAVARQIV